MSFPPWSDKKIRRCQQRDLTLLGTVGEIKLQVADGWDRLHQRWMCPAVHALGLAASQRVTPELADRLCLTATECGSYERVATVAAKRGSPVEDSILHKHVQCAGVHAQAQALERTQKILDPATRSQALATTRARRKLFLSSAMAGCGSGRSRKTASSRPLGCWTSIMSASIYGRSRISFILKTASKLVNGLTRCSAK